MNSIEVKKEIANAVTHGIGFLMCLVGVPIALALAVKTGSMKAIWSTAIYSYCLMMVYLCSTLYHSFSHPLTKRVLRAFDHIAIYFLIAGSYTPFMLFYFNDTKGHLALAGVWALVLIGTVFKIFFTGKWDGVSTAIYLGMGWTILLFANRLLSDVPHGVLVWLAFGGACYTFGIIFYAWKKYTYHHAIWHIFVLLGSLGHYMAVIKSFI
jgi:hemolysin III